MKAQELLDAAVDKSGSDVETNGGDPETEKSKSEENETEGEKKEEAEKVEEKEDKREEKREEDDSKEKLAELVRGELSEMRRENRQLHNMVTQLHQRHHEHTLKVRTSNLFLSII